MGEQGNNRAISQMKLDSSGKDIKSALIIRISSNGSRYELVKK